MLSFKAECCYFAVKKRYSSVGLGCGSKFFVKYKFIGRGTKCKYIFILFKRTLSQSFIRSKKLLLTKDFLVLEVPLKMVGLKLWGYVQDFFKEALCPQWNGVAMC